MAELRRLLRTVDRAHDNDREPDSIVTLLVNELAERWTSQVAPEVDHRRANLESELRSIGAAIDRLAEGFYVHEDIPEATYRTLRVRQEERRAVVVAEIEALPAATSDLEPLRRLASATDLERDDLERLLAVLVERIDVAKAPSRRPTVPERASILWTMTSLPEAAADPTRRLVGSC